MSRLRLDVWLAENGYFDSREKARRAVMSGCVWVAGQRVDKPGTSIGEDAEVEVRTDDQPFVSRAGGKLAAALDAFAVDPSGWVCLDVGASTGGFTDCLLQAGAAKIYAVDVGYGQLDYRLRTDPRVVVIERVNARYLTSEQVPEPCRLVVMDVSFISATKVMPAVVPFLEAGGLAIVLIKPQFEAGRHEVGKGGIIRSDDQRQRVVAETVAGVEQLGLVCQGVIDSPVHGAKGNVEALAIFLLPREGVRNVDTVSA